MLTDFVKAYIEAALWSSTDTIEGIESVPLDSVFDVSDLTLETLQKCIDDCEQFQRENSADLELAYDLYPVNKWSHDEQAGHDFWLTRNRHGAGFWDRGLGDVGDRLTQAAHKFGEIDPYVGDDGKLYF